LDRNVAAILAHRSKDKASPQHKQELAAIINLCGAGTAKVFASRGFRMIAGEWCGDHDVATYLAQISAMKREFLRLADDLRAARFGKRQRRAAPLLVRS
jgi:hypothetical protein